jgi:uncharacterized protein YbjT (DUF2867 family)
MTSTEKHYLIAMFGASGNINSSVIENLEKIMVTDGNKNSVISNYTLRIITRNPESLSDRRFNIKTEIVKGSICDEVELGRLLEGVDRVFVCLPQCLGDFFVYVQYYCQYRYICIYTCLYLHDDDVYLI